MEQQSRLQGARVLLVEDNAINREVALDFLESEGMHVEVALHGRQALEKLAAQRFDAVLMDCQMPIMDGFAATRAIREQPPLRDLPVIAMTGNADAGDRERALAAGMNDYIAKPIDIDEVLQTLARWIPPQPVQSPTPPAASQAQVLNSLPGVDAATALERLRGNDKVLRRTLLRFLEAHQDFVAKFTSTWTLADPQPGRRLAHDLHSLSGMLCMAEVRQCALALEQACVALDDEAVQARLKDLSSALEPVIRGLASRASQLADA